MGFGSFTNQIGRSGFAYGDIDDGTPELVVGNTPNYSGGDNRVFVVLENRPSSQDYFISDVSEFIADGFETLAAFDSDGDEVWEVMVVFCKVGESVCTTASPFN